MVKCVMFPLLLCLPASQTGRLVQERIVQCLLDEWFIKGN